MTLPELYPAPRQVRVLDTTARADGPVRLVADTSLPAQGYGLRIDDNGIQLAHGDDLGRRYGQQTLEQLRAPDGTFPHVAVDDWPDVPTRGFMLDVSRDRVPTRETLARLVEILARARYNHLELYIEHAFAYAGHDVVWGEASPITADDLVWLDDRCSAAGIELVGNQNCFGHLAPWLRHEPYRSWAECVDGFEVVPGLTMPPSVLAPTPENAAFALGLVREQLGSLRSRRVNIGCDETFELGHGASKARVDEIGTAAVYLEHLSRIVQPLLDDGSAVTFWGDVLERHPEELAQLPDGDLTPVIWTYESPQSSVPDAPPFLREVLAKLGIDLDQPPGFASHAEHVIAAGRPFWVAPGTSTWNTLVGRLDNALENLLDAATVARDVGCGGVLVTDWGDNGHHQPPSVSYPGIVYGGAVAWCVDANRDLDVAATIDRCVVGDSAGKIGQVLTTIGRAGAGTGVPTMNSSPLFNALLPHLPTASFGTAEPDAMAAVIASLDGAIDDLVHARPSAVDGTRVVDELTVATRLARLGALRMVEPAGGRGSSAAEQRAELAELIDRYRASWSSSSRPGGLDTSAGHLERTLRTYDEA